MAASKIRRAIFPVAGRGTRFLPITKANAKEMLPVGDRPLVQYAVEEAVAAGLDKLVFVSGRNKRSIEDHFDRNPELENALEKSGNTKFLRVVQEILPENVSLAHVRQPEPLGLGDAVLCAENYVCREDFAVLLPDDLILPSGNLNCLEQMLVVHSEYRTSVIAVERVASTDVGKYGIVDVEPLEKGVFSVKGIVEKPRPEEAPGNLAVVGRYILKPAIFDFLRRKRRGYGGEIQLTDALNDYLSIGRIIAYEYQGTRFDCGDKLGYLKANVSLSLQNQEIGTEFSAFLAELMDDASRFHKV